MKYKVSQMGVKITDLINELEKVDKTSDLSSKIGVLEELRKRVQSDGHTERIGQIINSLRTPNNFVDPISNKPYPDANNMIRDYISELKLEVSRMSQSNTNFNFNKFAQQVVEKKKKSPRGNPFRVLMGKVGKLLDHGLSKRDIVRYLMKEKIWNEETIEKSVKIVREYNKKKHRKQKKAQVEPTAKPGIIEKDFTKRSTPELMVSLSWLNSLMSVRPGMVDSKNIADKQGVVQEIEQIKSALRERGFSKENIDAL